MQRYKGIGIFLFIVFLYVYINPGNISLPIEKLEIPSGFGIDLVKIDDKEAGYEVSMSTYTFNKKDEVSMLIAQGTSDNIPQTREIRQMEANRKYISGLEKVLVVGEEMARYGIQNTVDILFSNQFINDLGFVVVCKAKALDILNFKVGDYPTSSDFIQGLVDNAKEHYFYSDNYKLIDMYVRLEAEGRKLVLPYIEIKGEKIEITGIAVFNKSKMVLKLGLEEAKLMNILRENNVKGVLTIQRSFDEYSSIYALSKRKITCTRLDDKYYFNIVVEIKGDIISNSMYRGIVNSPERVKEFEQELSKETEEKCKSFIDKMQNEYKLDILDLGRIAAAQFGRETGVDWDGIVTNSEISIEVKVKLDRMGRGFYD